MFNDWFTFVSAQNTYQISSWTKEKLFKLPFKTISYGKNSVNPAQFSHGIMQNKS